MFATDNHATSGAHANLPVGSVVANKYKVVNQCGTGNFARVFECVNVQTNERVALKLLKHGFERDADFECDVLQAINRHDPADEIGVVKLVERFEWHGHAAVVFKLKGKSLRSLSLPLSREQVMVVARDLAASLSFLHFKCRAVHTDLKPENVIAEIAPNAQGRQWAICDFGSASFYTSRLDTDLITTRPYRAPEVVLNRGWSYAADTWSLGCILYELRTGRKLFDGANDAAHLEAIQAKLGPIPGAPRPVAAASGLGSAFGRRVVLLKDEFPEDPDFTHLLLSLLRFDAGSRIKCCDVAAHPFVASLGSTGVSTTNAATAAQSNFGRSVSGGWSSASARSNDTSPNTISSLGSRNASSNASPVNAHTTYYSSATGTLRYGAVTKPTLAPSSSSAAPHSAAPASMQTGYSLGLNSARGAHQQHAVFNSAGRPLISPAIPSSSAVGLQSGTVGLGLALARRY